MRFKVLRYQYSKSEYKIWLAEFATAIQTDLCQTCNSRLKQILKIKRQFQQTLRTNDLPVVFGTERKSCTGPSQLDTRYTPHSLKAVYSSIIKS